MRNLYYLIICFLSFSVLSAQEKLSKEEKARREKNIQAGNPFAKYGCKAPVATLSKGKYLEVHDLDSIVTIGTSRWDVDNKKIVGDIKIDSLNVDAQPIGDAPGMWMSPDPLSEEFPSWSPYNMCYDNPVKYKDPDGRAADDWRNSDNKQIYDPEKKVYTKYATAQDIEFGESLRNNGCTGEEQFNYLVSNKTQPIQIDFLPLDMGGDSMYYFGQTYNDFSIDQKSGNVTKINSSRIEIYTGTSESFVKDISNNKLRTGEKIEGDAKIVKDAKLTAKDNITSVIGHELGHTTKDNQQKMLNEKKPNYKYNEKNSETIPEANRTNILKKE